MPVVAQQPKAKAKAQAKAKSQTDLDRQAQSAIDKAKSAQRKASDAQKSAAAGYQLVMIHKDVLTHAADDNQPNLQESGK